MTDAQKHAARLRTKAAISAKQQARYHYRAEACVTGLKIGLQEKARLASEDEAALLAGAEALEREEPLVKVTEVHRIMDHAAEAYQARLTLHLDRADQHFEDFAKHCEASEAIHERIAKALEPKTEEAWRVGHYRGQNYLIPVGREDEWQRWCDDAEPGEYTAIVPEWAVPVPDDVVITGWERP